MSAYEEAKRRIGDRANEAFGYRGKMIESGEAPFKCRSGSRYLYMDEFGSVHWCYQTRESFSRTCSPTPMLTFASSSTRRKTAMRSARSVAPEPPPRRTSGARRQAFLTLPSRRLHRRIQDWQNARVLQRSILRQHALENAVAFDEPMVERARDMERDDHADQNPADQMPDDNAVRQRPILAQYGRKVEETKDATGSP